jgi:hypothetical protein
MHADLSFNNITVIEGLSNLTKLTDLSLYNNKITSLENLEELVDLEVFSIGNNAIKKLDNFLYLRQFQKLRLLSMAGNPVCQDPESRSYVIAHCRCLSYLDYRLIDEATVVAAREQFNDELLELEERERAAEEVLEEERRSKELHDKLQRANLDLVYVLYEDLLKDDADLPKIRLLTLVVEPLDAMRASFEELTTEFMDVILKTFEKKEEEKSLFLKTYNGINSKNMSDGMSILEEFGAKKKRILREMHPGELSVDEERVLEDIRGENDRISDKLLEIEMMQVEQYEEIIREFERRMSELVNQNIEHVQMFFARLRELESSCFESMAALANQEIDKAAAAAAAGAAGDESDQEDADEGDEEVKAILSDKDALMNMLNSGHDSRISKIDAREDDMTQREHKSLEDFVSAHKNKEYQRNRDRVAEVWGQIDRNRREMDEYANEEMGDGR